MADALGLSGLRPTCLTFFGANADILLATRGDAALDSLHDTTLEAVEAPTRSARGLSPLLPPPPLVPLEAAPTPPQGTLPPSLVANTVAAAFEAAATVVTSSGGVSEAAAKNTAVSQLLSPPASLGALAAADAAARRSRALRKNFAATIRSADCAAGGAVLAPA